MARFPGQAVYRMHRLDPEAVVLTVNYRSTPGKTANSLAEGGNTISHIDGEVATHHPSDSNYGS